MTREINNALDNHQFLKFQVISMLAVAACHYEGNIWWRLFNYKDQEKTSHAQINPFWLGTVLEQRQQILIQDQCKNASRYCSVTKIID
jgi:hypothetical protein